MKMREEEIEKLRGVVRDCLSKHLYSSAIFFADKVAAFTSDPADIYMQAQALFLGRHYRRAFHLLNASQIVLRDLRFRYLAAKCLEEQKEWDQCLLMLGDAKVDEHGNVNDTKDCNVMYLDKEGEDREINISSAICFLRGKAYEALENRAQARLWYKAAIKADPLCYEALECLIENHMLTSEEEASLLSSLQFAPEDGWLSSFYSCLVKKYDKETVVEAKFTELEKQSCNINPSDPSFICTLKNNTDLLACKAEYYHQCGEYQKCFELTAILLEKDPFHMKCTLVHLAAAMELGHSNELYLMACNLVKDYPQKTMVKIEPVADMFQFVHLGHFTIFVLKNPTKGFHQETPLKLQFPTFFYLAIGKEVWVMDYFNRFGHWGCWKSRFRRGSFDYPTTSSCLPVQLFFPWSKRSGTKGGSLCLRGRVEENSDDLSIYVIRMDIGQLVLPKQAEKGVDKLYHYPQQSFSLWGLPSPYLECLGSFFTQLRRALSWFAVGCYYYCIKKYDQSRRYFSKAANLDGTFPPALIGCGNAYAAQEEGDQAMLAYRTAARLFPG
ncbi:Anaphase-promoting complex subunit 6 [Vitis vinifera]|uniref:Anaphase-promoting complex subunit 6 n=1 Tax=Vitis vinifera TaxID=29760 RepID=A0A438E5K9_VITVI|nr:Anaphase-promoting complex subunit 6 [Vitis vinifera]